MTWDEVAEVLNKNLRDEDEYWTQSAYRKKYQQAKAFNDEVFSKMKPEQIQTDIAIQTRELKKERIKIQTEKLELNRWLRENARDEMVVESIENAIANLQPLQIPNKLTIPDSSIGYCLLWGDEHLGVEFELKDIYGKVINSYSPEIFENRMWELLEYVKTLIKEKNIKILHCFSLGDFCDGILRVSQLMKLRYGIVEATIKYANFISIWLNELSKYVIVDFYMTHGNHSELRMIGQPKGTFADDNMGEVVAEFIKIRLMNNPNFNFTTNPTGNIFTQIMGHNILAIHGEVKNMEKALREFSDIYTTPIHYLCAGHLHHYKKETTSINTEVINVPSIIGVDPYGLSIRKTSAPSALLIEIEQNRGIICEHHLKLIS